MNKTSKVYREEISPVKHNTNAVLEKPVWNSVGPGFNVFHAEHNVFFWKGDIVGWEVNWGPEEESDPSDNVLVSWGVCRGGSHISD